MGLGFTYLLLAAGLTMMPSLLVLALAVNTSQTLIYSQVVLSFGIPFAIIPCCSSRATAPR